MSETPEMRMQRRIWRNTSLMVRGGASSCPCDLCNQPATDQHELVNRGRTEKNDDARLQSFRPELTAMLCRSCHSEAHNPETRDALFLKLYDLFGYKAVKDEFDKLAGMMESLDIELPEVNNGGATE